jgi:glycosyltransferase involved in cell wall biosynthesis
MNILMMASQNLKLNYGSTVRIKGLIKGLADYINKIFLFSPDIDEGLRPMSSIVWLRSKTDKPLLKGLCAYSYMLFGYKVSESIQKLFIPLKKNGKIDNIDIIHIHSPMLLPLALRFKRTFNEKAPILLDMHELYSLLPVKSHSKCIGLIPKYLNIIYEHSIICDESDVSGFIVASPLLKRFIINNFRITEEKIFVVQDGIDLNSIPQYDAEEAKRVRQSLNFHERIIITYVGGVTLHQGFYDILEAYKMAKKDEPRLALLIIVPCEIREILLRAGINSNDVRVIINIPRRQVYEYLYASDVLLLPHRRGTFHDYVPSLKLLDYMASGKPIVAYSLPSISSELINYPLRVLVKPNRPDELAKGILECIRLYRGIRVEGKSYVRKYDWNNVARELLDVYVKCIKLYK